MPKDSRLHMEYYGLIILGQGSAAFAAAIIADEMGMRKAKIGSNTKKGTVQFLHFPYNVLRI